jgi:uncharacterized membrane protein
MNTPSGTKLVEARYVPKSIKVSQHGDGGHRIDVKAPTLLTLLVILILVILGFYIVPTTFMTSGFAMGGFRFSLVSALIGAFVPLAVLVAIGYFVNKMFRPPIIITRDGVQIGKRFFAMGDVDGFRNFSDDLWFLEIAQKLNLEAVGIQYGIYSIHTPYLMAHGEADKVAIYLSKLLKAIAPEPGQDREKKIQQAEEF